MKYKKIDFILGDLFGICGNKSESLYNLILENKYSQVLELGFAHGRSSAYIAAALDELEGESETKKLVTIDRFEAKTRDPNIYDVTTSLKLDKYINPIFSQISYNWELLKIIEDNSIDNECVPCFDLCFIDGAHDWLVDGYAFFLCDKLLKAGGAIIFDDLHWTLNKTIKARPEFVIDENLTLEYKETRQVQKVVDLLVKQDKRYKILHEDSQWAVFKKEEL